MRDYQTDNPPYMTGQAADQQRLMINSYMRKVYNWMGAGLAISALTAWWCMSSVTVLSYFIDFQTGSPTMLWFICLFAELGLVIAVSTGIKRFQASTAALMFVLYAALNGFTLSPILLAYTSASVTKAFALAAATFIAASAYGAITKRDLTGMGQFLMMGLIGIIIAMLVNMFMGSSTVDYVISCLGVIIFTGLTAYDTQVLRGMMAQAANDTTVAKMAIFGALKLYLDFINLFIMLLRIFGDRR